MATNLRVVSSTRRGSKGHTNGAPAPNREIGTPTPTAAGTHLPLLIGSWPSVTKFVRQSVNAVTTVKDGLRSGCYVLVVRNTSQLFRISDGQFAMRDDNRFLFL